MKMPETLINKILNKKCVLFLGAGATLESGGALGKDLGKYIYSNIGDIGIDHKDDLGRYTQLLLNAGYRDDIESKVRERLANLTPSTNFSKVADIPWKAIYTTNYDDLVEKSYNKQRYYECTVINHSSLGISIPDSAIPLYKINGDINVPYTGTNPLVITLNDLRDSQIKNEQFINQLMKDMNDTFVFVGYSFQDDHEIVMNILDSFRKNPRWESIKEKYVILPNISDDLKLDLESFRIKYIKGTADNFFAQLSKKSSENLTAKLSVLKKNYNSNTFLKDLSSRTLQHISECFDIYDSNTPYPADCNFYYHGGGANWGTIKNGFDISRNVTIKSEADEIQSNTESLFIAIQEFLQNHKFQKILLEGPSVSGKTTTLYRCCFDLVTHGTLAFIYRQQSMYTPGCLFDIYKNIGEPFVIFVDDIFVAFSELSKMIGEVEKNNLPIMFILSTRISDWENNISNYNKNMLKPFDAYINMQDTFDSHEAERLVDIMSHNNVINCSNKLERFGYIKKFQKNHNIIEILIEVLDIQQLDTSICAEYDVLSTETKYAYGIISLIYKYGLKTRWELLQRTISTKYDFSWQDFIDQILLRDAKGTLFDDEIQGSFYLYGRHRFICNKIVQIHYQGNYSDEIQDIKNLIVSAAGIDADERFIGSLIHSILKDTELYYTPESLLDLLNFAIDNFENIHNHAYINHLKGEYYLSMQNYSEAIRCFDTNVQNSLNLEYSLNSLGKAYYYLAQREFGSTGQFRMHIDSAIAKLVEGVRTYKTNEYYYSLLIMIYSYLRENECISEKNENSWKDIELLAEKYIGKHTFDKLCSDRSAIKDTME